MSVKREEGSFWTRCNDIEPRFKKKSKLGYNYHYCLGLKSSRMRSDILCVVTNFSRHGVYCETFDVALRIYIIMCKATTHPRRPRPLMFWTLVCFAVDEVWASRRALCSVNLHVARVSRPACLYRADLVTGRATCHGHIMAASWNHASWNHVGLCVSTCGPRITTCLSFPRWPRDGQGHMSHGHGMAASWNRYGFLPMSAPGCFVVGYDLGIQ